MWTMLLFLVYANIIFRLYMLHPQGSVIPWNEYVSGSNVHLLLVLCYCGHGHCGDDLQVHWIPRVCLQVHSYLHFHFFEFCLNFSIVLFLYIPQHISNNMLDLLDLKGQFTLKSKKHPLIRCAVFFVFFCQDCFSCALQIFETWVMKDCCAQSDKLKSKVSSHKDGNP